VQLTANGAGVDVDDRHLKTPLLLVLRDVLGMHGTKSGCGRGYCEACTVLIDGRSTRSCRTTAERAGGTSVTTIEGLSADSSHPVQRAWVAERVPQCGYCQSGQIMSAADLLQRKPHPTRSEIVEHMSAHICRCGTYQRIVRAIERAAQEA